MSNRGGGGYYTAYTNLYVREKNTHKRKVFSENFLDVNLTLTANNFEPSLDDHRPFPSTVGRWYLNFGQNFKTTYIKQSQFVRTCATLVGRVGSLLYWKKNSETHRFENTYTKFVFCK